MSETTPLPAPASSDPGKSESEEAEKSSAGTPPAPGGKKKRKRRTWGQRLKLTALVVAILVLCFRVAVNLLLPTVLGKVAGAYGMVCGYDRLNLSALGGNAGIWGFALRPKGGGDLVLRADYVEGTISPWNLFRGKLVVYRAEVDGVDVLLEREADGSLPLLKALAKINESKQPARAPAAAGKPMSLEAPLRVDAVRLTHVNAKVRDKSVSPVFEASIRTNVRVSDVGAAGAPARFELEVSADPVMDSFRVWGEAHSTPTSVEGVVNVLLRGVHPKPAAAYLAPLGLKPVADDVTVSARAKFRADTIPGSPDVSAELTVEDVKAKVDLEEWAALGRLSVKARRINMSAVELGEVAIEGGMASAKRAGKGGLRIAGMEIVPIPKSEKKSNETGDLPDFRVAVDELRMKDLRAVFDDEVIEGGKKLEARLDAMSVKHLVMDRAHRDEKSEIAGAASIPGVIGDVKFAGGAVVFAAKKRVEMKVEAGGIKGDAVRPYLEMLWIVPELKDGKFEGELSADLGATADGSLLADATFKAVRFSNGKELFGMGSAKVDGISIDPKTGAIKVASLELSGPTLPVTRKKSGNLAALGFRAGRVGGTGTGGSGSTENESGPTTRPVADAIASLARNLELPRVEVGKISWKDMKLELVDEMSGGQVLTVGDAGVEASDIVVDPTSKEAGKPGKFKVWIAIPKVAEKLAAEGTVTPGKDGLAIEAVMTGSGITAEALTSYLKPLGIEPKLTDGRFTLSGKAIVKEGQKATTVSLDVQNVAYKDGDTELAGVDAVHVSEMKLSEKGVEIGEVRIDRPRGRVARNKDGSFQAGGIRLVAATQPEESFATTQPDGDSPSTQPATVVASSKQPPAPTTAPASWKLPAAPVLLTLKGFHLKDLSVAWSDETVFKPVNTTLTSSVDLEDVRIGTPEVSWAKFYATARVEGVIDRAEVAGTVCAAPDSPGVKLKIEAEGIRAGDLAAYLPEGLATTLKSGKFFATLDAGASNHRDGGLTGHLVVNDLNWEDGKPLVKLGAFRVDASRVDPQGGVIAVEEVSSAGFETDVTMGKDGAIEAAGIRVGGKSATTQSAAVANAPEVKTAVAETAPSSQPVDVKALVAEARRAVPLVTVNKVDLGVKRVTVAGLTDGAPVSLENVSVRNRGQIQAGGKGSDTHGPMAVDVEGGLSPVVGKFAVGLQALPYAVTPSVSVEVIASDINGKGLTDVAPELKDLIDGSELTRGTFKSRVEVTVNYGRRGPRDWDLGRGFVLDLNVKPVELRGEPDGAILAGVEEIRSEGIKVDPAKGDVRVRALDITKPIGRVERDEKGIHVAGFLIPEKKAKTQPAGAESKTAVAQKNNPSPRRAGAQAQATPQRPKNEIRLDHLTVSEIDFVVRDKTTTPNTVVPLNGLDVDVRDVSNQMPFTGRPVRFSVLVTSGKVPLPVRKSAGGGAQLASAQGSGAGGEMRDLFSQVTANGAVAVVPAGDKFVLNGWAKTTVSGFELLGVSGLAEQQKVKINDGIFDEVTDLKFQPSGDIQTHTSVVFTNLSLSEPPNGPVQSTLQLQAPLDVAILAVKAVDDTIKMSIPVPIKQGAVSKNDVMGPAIGVVSQVMGAALANFLPKMVAGAGNALGLGEEKKKVVVETVGLRFSPGYAGLDEGSLGALNALANRMKKEGDLELQVRHDLTAGDVARVAVRANPSPEQSRSIAERLRAERAELVERRAKLAGQARGELGSRPESQASATLESLRALDRQIAQTENAMDQFYDLMRPGADRQADRRTRAAALEVARQRIAAVRDALIAAGVAGADQRVHATNPVFSPTDSEAGGLVVITLVPKKK